MTHKRLFFGVWPDENVLKKIISVQASLGLKMKPIAADNIHMTLAFIGQADKTYQRCLQEKAGLLEAQPFKLELSSLGYFKKPKVLWLGMPLVPTNLKQLVEGMNKGFRVCGYVPEQRKYIPHVSLFRKASCLEQVFEFEPIAWFVDRFYMAESVSGDAGVVYKKLCQFELLS